MLHQDPVVVLTCSCSGSSGARAFDRLCLKCTDVNMAPRLCTNSPLWVTGLGFWRICSSVRYTVSMGRVVIAVLIAVACQLAVYGVLFTTVAHLSEQYITSQGNEDESIR